VVYLRRDAAVPLQLLLATSLQARSRWRAVASPVHLMLTVVLSQARGGGCADGPRALGA
jgi:hypothetical protein